ncbi:hypothetical protein WV31_10310 [Magnetospirillum sp. ME-1]|uniref:hypothetical protein n=1 Tax=Magnetospirillum sp. ME-1 TaxID=1639348 RepID=UPI000A17995E|nr:hypothetical protein [Magnetospirillum sp. ME-1]ARJ66019.1 hypothetical protein WV31_10310 [Magnetospirillum sp. ME-1]
MDGMRIPGLLTDPDDIRVNLNLELILAHAGGSYATASPEEMRDYALGVWMAYSGGALTATEAISKARRYALSVGLPIAADTGG